MSESSTKRDERRQFPRYDVRCRAKILIGNRHYAGHLHNISRGGAKVRTISRIRGIGEVILTLPDLPPVRCQLRWADAYDAGVLFNLNLTMSELARWAETRSSFLVNSTAGIPAVKELAA